MPRTEYRVRDEQGIEIPVSREAASRLSWSGLTVTATTRGDGDE